MGSPALCVLRGGDGKNDFRRDCKNLMYKVNIEESKSSPSLAEFVCSPEPLSEDKIEFILNYKSENQYIDFKVSFNTGEQREWLNISKDIYAFANTDGGYIVFGVEDKMFNKIGIEERDYRFLIDPDNIHKKINPYVSPPLISLRTFRKVIDEKNFIIIHIPPSHGKTHIIVKEGKFANREEKEIILLRKSEIYVRRSGSTSLIEPIDLDNIIEKRLNYYKESLLRNIVKVVEAPPEKEILIRDPMDDELKAGEKKVKLSSDPKAIPVAGISSTVTPQTDEDEIATAVALFRKDKGNLPGINLLYRVYENRHSIKLSTEYFEDIALISICLEVPCFFWLQFLDKEEITKILDCVFERGNGFAKENAFRIAACLGKSYFNGYMKKADNEDQYSHTKQKYNNNGSNGLFTLNSIEHDSVERMETKATELVIGFHSQICEKGRIMDPYGQEKMWAIDYKLYADKITKKATSIMENNLKK
jgi:hypothetical protein